METWMTISNKANAITVQAISERHFDFSVVDTKVTNRKYIREFTDAQIIAAFLLIALHMPRGLSQRAQFDWLREFCVRWSNTSDNRLLHVLNNSSKTSLERYMHIANDANLITTDGKTVSFGDYVMSHLITGRNALRTMPIYSDQPSALLFSEALGVPVAARLVTKVGHEFDNQLGNDKDKDATPALFCKEPTRARKPGLRERIFNWLGW